MSAPGAPPCAGMSLRVIEHPEARVDRLGGYTPTTSATSLERFGRASIKNLTPNEPAEVDFDRSTCTLATALASSHSRRHPLVANTVTSLVRTGRTLGWNARSTGEGHRASRPG